MTDQPKPERCTWIEDALVAPPTRCPRLLKPGRSGYCAKHERMLLQLERELVQVASPAC